MLDEYPSGQNHLKSPFLHGSEALVVRNVYLTDEPIVLHFYPYYEEDGNEVRVYSLVFVHPYPPTLQADASPMKLLYLGYEMKGLFCSQNY